jgi:hypothetical protein
MRALHRIGGRVGEGRWAASRCAIGLVCLGMLSFAASACKTSSSDESLHAQGAGDGSTTAPPAPHVVLLEPRAGREMARASAAPSWADASTIGASVAYDDGGPGFARAGEPTTRGRRRAS